MGYKKYVIEKGEHALPILQRFGLIFSRSVSAKFYFEPSCFVVVDGNDKYDINKLFGYSNGIDNHYQSARVGWRCLDGNKIQLLTYVYNKGLREPEKILAEIDPWEVCTVSIADKGTEYVFKVTRDTDVVSYTKEPKPKTSNFFYYKQFPYFGGNQPAPQDITIFLDFL